MNRHLRTGVIVAVAMMTPVAFGFRPRSAVPAAAPPPAGSARPEARGEALRFENIPWGAARAEVERALVAGGHARGAAGEAWFRARRAGQDARATPEYSEQGGLIAMTLRFSPGTTGDALRLYVRLVEDMRRRHGPWLVQVDPARRAQAPWRFRGRDPLGDREPAAATLWVSPADDAAAVQLDERHVVWLRFEARDWAARRAEPAER